MPSALRETAPNEKPTVDMGDATDKSSNTPMKINNQPKAPSLSFLAHFISCFNLSVILSLTDVVQLIHRLSAF